MKAYVRICCLLVLYMLFSISLVYGQSGNIVSPEEFLGFKVGADFKVARWSKVYDYFTQLGKSSDRIHVRELGKSTEGNPFIIVMISDAKTIKERKKYKDIQRQLADPRGLSREEEKKLIAEGKT
ncbi:hypothetical protein KAS50_05845, partial [bacterium]|nr:hypothetical protein [bacterium]